MKNSFSQCLIANNAVAICFTLSLTSALVVTIWLSVDASVSQAIVVMQEMCGVSTLASNAFNIDIIRPLLQWNLLGARLAGLVILFTVCIVSIGLVFLTVALRPTPYRLVTCAITVVMWVCLLISLDTIEWWRLKRQVKHLLPEFVNAGEKLTYQWPTTPGEIVPGIEFTVSATHPNVLMVRTPPSFPSHVTFGHLVQRSSRGVLRFGLAGAPDSNVEYHPEGTAPGPFVSEYGYASPQCTLSTELADHWFLVKYQ